MRRTVAILAAWVAWAVFAVILVVRAPGQPPREELKAPRVSAPTIDARCVKVNDGDSITVEIDVLGKPWIPIIVRVFGIDTPELKDPRPRFAAKAIAARARLASLCSGPVTLENVQRDKYFRLLAVVKCRNQDVAKVLLREGHAKPYNGQGPKPWGPQKLTLPPWSPNAIPEGRGPVPGGEANNARPALRSTIYLDGERPD